MKQVSRAAVAIVAIALAGCVNIKAGEPRVVKTFILEARPATTGPAATDRHAVRLLPVRAAAGYDTDRMAYRRRPNELEYYARHAWIDSPARLIDPLFVAALGQAGVRAVTAAGATAVPLRVEAELLAIYQDFTVTPSRSRVGLRVQMVDAQSGSAIAEQVFAADAPSPSEDAYGGVRAANEALAQVLDDAARFVGSVAAKGPVAPAPR